MSNKLTVVAPNRNRLCDNESTHFFFKSLSWQTRKDFDFIIVDGGSDNFEWVKNAVLRYNKTATVLQHKLGKDFLKPILNNIGIRNAKTPYIMTTDVDLLYAPKFMETVIESLEENLMIESRTMYWKEPLVNKIYNGELDPEKNIDACKIGRIKKRSTCGGCQCMHINSWTKLRGFDEKYVGWGSEDFDLLTRVGKAKIKVKWLGESINDIMLFHQPHAKDQATIARELDEQDKNKILLANIKSYDANPNGWGGIYEE